MDTDRTSAPSARWHEPKQTGDFWTACVKYHPTPREHAAGIEVAAYGPTRAACLRETGRLDTLWAYYPAQHGDSEGTRKRLRFLASGVADGGAA